MKNTYLSKLLAVLGFALFANTASALDLNIELGGGISYTGITIRDIDENHDKVATISKETSFTPYFALAGSDYFPFEKVNVGLSWQFWASPFEANKQLVDSKFKDLDTKITGTYAYALPILFYRWGDKGDEQIKNYRISIGMGYGLSHVSLKGTFISTESDEPREEEVKGSQTYYAAGLFARAQRKKLFYQLSTYSPQVKVDNYKYSINNVSHIIGYQFFFSI